MGNEIKTYSPEYTNGDFNMKVAPKTGSLVEDDPSEATSISKAVESREVAQVQAQYVMAEKFRRDQTKCYLDIMDACKRKSLAEQAIYAYPRGGKLVTGPSIRLAEVIAQAWGNLEMGIREISQANGVSVAEAYVINLQNRNRYSKTFHVPHVRDTKKGKQRLTDARDIYELVANQGARRLRKCILEAVPGDIIEAAVEQCHKTLETSDVPIKDRVRKMVTLFDELGVKIEHLEKRLGHNLDAIIPAEIVTLTGIYKSLKDGMAKREDFFDIQAISVADDTKAELEQLIEKNKPTKINKETGELTK